MSFGKEISWEYADNNNFTYLLSVWLQQIVYRHKISDTEQQKRVLVDCWTRLSQDTLNRAIDQLPKKTGDDY